MKISMDKLFGLLALGGASVAFLPDLIALMQSGVTAFDGCKEAARPFVALLVAFVAAYLKKSPVQPK